ncbi:RecQ family ATP-dependent DNA helicase [Candidatus Laterigemmans baculatus]|uniref:RecQ family ATP-dependent DNA helicase n=1 Tax=Candidatus Laterigemmans baculatus TaxID=2770505 RepID=UPI00193BBE01|nr:RecQ family ATP-dependent DNA helicase [Candidatus Laterigemmans baculatus]
MPVPEAQSAAVANPAGLLERFGLESFRPGQDDVVGAVLGGEDVLCVMPTGGGKSLCYQLPSLALTGTTIVVSPLIALMKDQVDTLRQRGISAALINSTLSAAEQSEAMEQMAAGTFDLVYIAPERLRNSRFLEALERVKVSLLAVDEAHCISEWGHDFRPDYARLGKFRERYLGDVQTIALTATATPTVREDICQLLHLKAPRHFVTGFGRKNLRFAVEHCKGDRDKDAWLTEYLAHQRGAGIIYAATRKRCEELAGWLPEKVRRPIGVYHAGLEPAQRQAVQEQFMSGKLSAIVATNAFGMGIDKSDLRFVVHYNMPGTLEAYYQEAGRAGRDGLPSECVLLFSYSDRHIQEFFIENRYPTAELVHKVYRYLLSRTEDPIELTLAQVRDAVEKEASPEAIGTAETLLGRAGVLKRLDSSSNQAVLRIDSDLPTLLDLLPREAKVRRRVMRAVEKIVGSRRYEDVYVRPQRICELAEVNRDQLSRVMRELSGLKAFDYVPPFRGRAVHLLRHDLAFADLQIDFDELERRKRAEYDKLEAVISFARTAHCRQREILHYFGDAGERECGSCDRCQPQRPPQLSGSGAAEAAAATAPATSNAKTVPSDDPALVRGLQIALSGVARTHGRFGKGLVAQMLCGSQNKKIQQWKLNRLSTYGMLSGLKQTQVSEVLDALTEIGLLTQVEVDQRRPTIHLTDSGKAVMLGRQSVPSVLKLPYPLAKRLAAIASRLEPGDVASRSAAVSDEGQAEAGSESGAGQGEADPETVALVDRLRHWRRRVAAAAGLPAFRILTNATLQRIAEQQPKSVGELEQIKGIGPSTIEEYGYDLIELVVHSSPAEKPEASGEESEASGEEPEASAEEPEESGEEPEASGEEPEQEPKQEQEQALDAGSAATAPRAQPGYWTWRLLNDGYSAEDVESIRRIDRERLLDDLLEQARRGRPVALDWVRTGSPGSGPAAPNAAGGAVERRLVELAQLILGGGRG